MKEHSEPRSEALTGGSPQGIRMLRLPEVRRKTGLSDASIYRAMASGDFPKPARVGARAVAWA